MDVADLLRRNVERHCSQVDSNELIGAWYDKEQTCKLMQKRR